MQKRTIEELPNGNVMVRVPISIRGRYSQKRIITPDGKDKPMNDSLLMLIARGHRWQAFIDDGRFKNVRELATAVGRDRSYCASLLRLAMLSPEIIHKVIQGEAAAMMTVEFLRSRLPVLWNDQMTLLFK